MFEGTNNRVLDSFYFRIGALAVAFSAWLGAGYVLLRGPADPQSFGKPRFMVLIDLPWLRSNPRTWVKFNQSESECGRWCK